jgi:hypothetical protein
MGMPEAASFIDARASLAEFMDRVNADQNVVIINPHGCEVRGHAVPGRIQFHHGDGFLLRSLEKAER